MDIIAHLADGFVHCLTPLNLSMLVVGIVVGLLIGVLPGLTLVMGVALALPFTYKMDVTASIVLLTAMYVSGTYGGAFTAILFRIPGEPIDVPMLWDGYTMGRKGQPSKALGWTLVSALGGGLLSAVVMVLSPLGIGGALRTGFRYAVENGYRRGIQFDADGQHDPAEIAALLAPLAEGADMVVGSRFAGAGDYRVGRSRGLAMNILRWAIRRLAGQRFTDTSSGFRSFGPEVLSLFAAEYPIEYMDSVEALVMACRAGYDVREIPTVMHERTGGLASNRSLRLAYHYVRVLVSLANTPRHARSPRPTEIAS